MQPLTVIEEVEIDRLAVAYGPCAVYVDAAGRRHLRFVDQVADTSWAVLYASREGRGS